MNRSTEKRMQEVKRIVETYYEAGSLDRCKLWVFRNYVRPHMGISERTFFRYLSDRGRREDERQLKLDI